MGEDVDVLIVGAGIAGVSSAVHLSRELPDKSYVLLEKRQRIGGTWDLFRYPGVRSDSDMYTLGFDFQPWEHEKAIAPGETIRDYIQKTAAEHGVGEKVRFGTRLLSADWDSQTGRWTATTDAGDSFQAGFIHFATGYYSYEQPYIPEYPGRDDFTGPLIHPQHWPEDLDVRGKRVVVIGSGATAMTLVPALAKQGAKVTMLQRSPTYVLALPDEDKLAQLMARVGIPLHLAYRITRTNHLWLTYGSYRLLTGMPGLSKRLLRLMQQLQLPKGYPLDVHFNPTYAPWEERLCVIPNGDLFKVIKDGSVEIVTDRIRRFTADGIELESGASLQADAIVSATGFNLQLLGGAELSVDGQPVNLGEAVSYKGAMFTGVPNVANTFGYVNASWTLKADLISRYVVRLLKFMDAHGYNEALPLPPPPGEQLRPFVDLQSGYIKRGEGRLPQRAFRDPWDVHQSYSADRRLLVQAPVDGEGIRFTRSARATTAAGTR